MTIDWVDGRRRSGWSLRTLRALIRLSACFISSCAPLLAGVDVSKGVPKIPCCGGEYEHQLQVKYLGAGGFLLQHGKDVILTAPFFSNPGMLRVLFWSIHADPERINAFLPPVEEVKAILVGHSHYDHLMDIPYIAYERAPSSIIYGSHTVKNILSAVLPPERLIALDQGEGDPCGLAGGWVCVKGTRIRILATTSEHAPHVCLLGGCIKVFQGDVMQPLVRLPQTAWQWKEGPTFAYLIDFLDENNVVQFRVHYQDAASGFPKGAPLVSPHADPKPVDVAILCVPGADYVNNYPHGIVSYLQPRYVILAHWESFFRPRAGDPGDVEVISAGTHPREFMDKVTKAWSPAKVEMPLPGAWLQVPPRPSIPRP